MSLDSLLPAKQLVVWDGEEFWLSDEANAYSVKALRDGEQIRAEILSPGDYPSEHPNGAVILHGALDWKSRSTLGLEHDWLDVPTRRVVAVLPYGCRTLPCQSIVDALWPAMAAASPSL